MGRVGWVAAVNVVFMAQILRKTCDHGTALDTSVYHIILTLSYSHLYPSMFEICSQFDPWTILRQTDFS